MIEKREVIYVLSHLRPLPDGEEEERQIGVYSSKERAELREACLQDQPIFREAPDEFYVVQFEIGEDCWTDGYVTVY